MNEPLLCKDFLALTDWSQEQLIEMLDLARQLKSGQKRGDRQSYLADRTLALIFQKSSTRTRVSFETGMYHLGGKTLFLGPDDIKMGQREPIRDIARVLSRYVDLIVARLFGHDDLVELATQASVPVINGLTDLLHPCQVMADVLTIIEQRGHLDDLHVAYIGDGNNMANSWINMASILPMKLRLATPAEHRPHPSVLQAACRRRNVDIEVTSDPREAARGADVLYTDVWVSLGQESTGERKRGAFTGFQINEELVQLAHPEYLVMHGLPARRGEEITDEVLEGPHSIVFDQAENRLHVQKAIMVTLARNAGIASCEKY